MIHIDFLRDFIRELDKKEFRLYAGLYIAISAFLIIGIVVRHIYLVREAKAKVVQLNDTRKKVQKIITDFGLVTQQRTKVDILLAKDKNFHIQKFYQDVAQRLAIPIDAKEKLSSQKLDNGYIEESLTISLLKITTKQLCDLLKDIEGEERIYIKNIEISKNLVKKINVTMDIATLRSKSE